MTRTVGLALCAATARLKQTGVEQPRLDARLLLADALGVPAHRLILEPNAPVPDMAAEAFERALARRVAREPVSRILGRREFWSLNFRVTPATLDPRPDSETLVEAVLDAFPDRQAGLRVLDFGTGTGCLLLAVLSEYPASRGLGIDTSVEAVETARDNAEDLALADRAEMRAGDWGQGIGGEFDIILSNPPYIEAGTVPTLAPEVARYDPRGALTAGPDGLEAYRALMPHLARLLAPGGQAFLELGAGQADAVAALAQSQGLAVLGRRADLGGIVRCLRLGRQAF
ncbi:peptide chain release factor N(5)-glutamine methyltransferase [Oceanibaculum pacificum]|uniref:Release factor glutamine methyltransferase n=1 Tax=Oceanibaculum pacificum TaxID=580166 RepID=A0A154WET0_9PROT|nr:peptide chain release factor N(5)-glutamine methyltransferase [Oceanibaculum pacificum]KZD12034.1 protein-(glutamine-N5) methyltransferase, release factor-specific [Oceanibaculum pacificum]